MSAISQLIEKLKKEDEERKKQTDIHFAEQNRRYAELKQRVDYYNDESTKYIDGIKKSLDQLVANKHTIEKALDQTENLEGLPIPNEHHRAVIDMTSKIIEFLNHTDVIHNPNIFAPEQFHENIVSATESVADDLKECHIGVHEAQALNQNTQSLINLASEAIDDEPKELDSSNLPTIPENEANECDKGQ